MAGLARDLFEFVEDLPSIGGGFTTFLATFRGPNAIDEVDFERLLWAQLQGLYEQDRLHHGWDPSVSSDPEDPDFSFSFAGRAFFVVGLHPASSRYARRFAWPTLVFNVHEQFERLREGGNFARVREVIRAREIELQGSLNPNLSDFGELPEARQYSGRPVGKGWRCPFDTGESASDEGCQG
jgi:FPC/CPF motif-containing protein YcgG